MPSFGCTDAKKSLLEDQLTELVEEKSEVVFQSC
jgi:hypothetical protein